MQHDFILLDRSGSMVSLWTEALSSVNAYVKKLAEEKVDTGVTLATFDKDGSVFKFEVIRDRITPSTWKPVSNEDAEPRGMTPLNDAIGRIVALAKAGFNGVQYEKVALIIMTDGLENASVETNRSEAGRLLDECRAKNWQVLFLGANFDNMAQATSLGNAPSKTASASPRGLTPALEKTASLRASYAASGAAMDYSDTDKKRFSQR